MRLAVGQRVTLSALGSRQFGGVRTGVVVGLDLDGEFSRVVVRRDGLKSDKAFPVAFWDLARPRRVQRSRLKGWRLPANTVIVSRPSRWGNPFVLSSDWLMWTAVAMGFDGNKAGRAAAAVALYRAWITGTLVPLAPPEPGGEVTFASGAEVPVHGLVMGFAGRVMHLYPPPTLPDQRPDLSPLRGKDLACWCALDQPCHADVLLELANAEAS